MPSPTIRTYFWSTGRPSGSKAVLFTPSPHRAPSSGRSPPLLRFIEFLLRLLATRTTPVIGQVFKGNAGRDVLIWVALFGVVGVFAGAFGLCYNRICLVSEFLMEHKDAKFIINGTQRHKDAKTQRRKVFYLCAAFASLYLCVQFNQVSSGLRVEEIFLGFLGLLPQHFEEHHYIGFYASELCITTTYLSRVVR